MKRRERTQPRAEGHVGVGVNLCLMTLFSESDTERSDHWGQVGVGLRRRFPETMVNACGVHGILGQRFQMKAGQSLALWLSALFLEDVWEVMLQPPAFPTGRYSGWEKKLRAQPRIGLAW